MLYKHQGNESLMGNLFLWIAALSIGSLLTFPWSNLNKTEVKQKETTTVQPVKQKPASRYQIKYGALVYAHARIKEEGWGNAQWLALYKLWTRESNWNYQAKNKHSTAYGIPQILDLPHDMPANQQVDRGIKYIKERYGTPSRALRHHYRKGWY